MCTSLLGIMSAGRSCVHTCWSAAVGWVGGVVALPLPLLLLLLLLPRRSVSGRHTSRQRGESAAAVSIVPI